jgi:hypothetical protein
LPNQIALILIDGKLEILDMDKGNIDLTGYPSTANIGIYNLRVFNFDRVGYDCRNQNDKSSWAPVCAYQWLIYIHKVSEDSTPRWHLFNDFTVLSLEKEERIFRPWKVSKIIYPDSLYNRVCSLFS